MNHYKIFKDACEAEIAEQAHNEEFSRCSAQWMQYAEQHRYTYHFEWLGRPIIQYPQDIVAMQEILWRVQPEVIVETGIAHGGSLIFYASMLELLCQCGVISQGTVVGVDIDIREHNRRAIEAHPLAHRITLIEGSSTSADVVSKVHDVVGGRRCLVALDSNHTHDHVLAELRAYAKLVTPESYCVVFDTAIEFSDVSIPGKPWGKGNSPMTAVRAFLSEHPEFTQDNMIHEKLCITESCGGYLKRMR